MISWPRDLVVDLARRRCVIVVGAGVSINSTSNVGKRPKTWAQFLDEAARRMPGKAGLKKEVRRIARDGDPLTACEIIRNQLGTQNFRDLCREEFLTPAFRPSRIHELIHLLDARIVLTPNFDIIYESYVASKEPVAPTVKTYRDSDLAEAVRLPNRLIFKLHGTITAPHEMIFTRSDYAAARMRYPASYAVVSALILTHTFLFLGCGLHDPDVTLLLENYAFGYSVGRAHYMTLPHEQVGHRELQRVVETTRNVSLLTYSPENVHKDLTDSLESLAVDVGGARRQLLTSQNW